MYILMISRGIPSVKDPQWGCFELDQARALKDLGHKIVVISLDRRFRFQKLRLNRGNINGIDTYCFPTIVPGNLLSRISLKLSRVYFSNKMLKLFEKVLGIHGKPDLIYSHYQNNILYLRDIKKKYKIPIVGMEHWSEVKKNPVPKNVIKNGEIAYEIPNLLLSVSVSLQERIYEIWGKKSIVVNNMVGSEFSYVEKKESRKFRFISVGQLIHRKGYDLLVEAFDKSELKNNNNVELLIIGDGEERENIQKMIDQHALSDCIKLLGIKSKNEINELLSESDAFVLATRSETFGVVYIEAMMVGLPVIGTICGGPEEFINESNGILVDVEDIKGLTNALNKMYHNISDYDRKYIANECKNSFSPSVIGKKIETIFNQVICKK